MPAVEDFDTLRLAAYLTGNQGLVSLRDESAVIASGSQAGGESLVRGLAELTIETTDLAAAEHFYRAVVGLELLAREDDRVWLAVGSQARLGLWSPGTKEFGDQGGRHVHFALSVEPGGLDRLVDRLRRAGVGARGPVEHSGGDRSLYFEDPAGNVVEAWDFFEREPGARDGVEAL